MIILIIFYSDSYWERNEKIRLKIIFLYILFKIKKNDEKSLQFLSIKVEINFYLIINVDCIEFNTFHTNEMCVLFFTQSVSC